MSINNFKWDAPPKQLEWQENDTAIFLIEKFHDNNDAKSPILTLECRVVSSDKNPEFTGEKTSLYFPFLTNKGLPNRATYYFLMQFFKEELENAKEIPYFKLQNKVFSALVTLNKFVNARGEEKVYQNFKDYKSLGDAEDQEGY